MKMSKDSKKKKKFSSEEVSVFCEQIAMLLNSGIPLYEGIYMLFREMEDTKTKDVLQQLDKSMKSNQPFYQALQSTESFPDYMIHMVRVGETTGKLEEVMKALADYYERESDVKAGIKSAVTYPVVLFAMMSVIILVLVIKILPLFESMFLELNADVAQSSYHMLNIGMTLGKVVAVITWICLLGFFCLLLLYQTKQGEYKIHKFLTTFLLTHKLSEAMATGKFISSMALMLSSGIEIQKSMDIAYGASNNRKVKEKIKQCRMLLEKGEPLDDAIHETKILNGMESRLVVIAAKTGAQDLIFAKLSEQYNKKITMMLNRLSTTIETVLVVLLAVLVGAVLIAVMLPLVCMISSIG